MKKNKQYDNLRNGMEKKEEFVAKEEKFLYKVSLVEAAKRELSRDGEFF